MLQVDGRAKQEQKRVEELISFLSARLARVLLPLINFTILSRTRDDCWKVTFALSKKIDTVNFYFPKPPARSFRWEKNFQISTTHASSCDRNHLILRMFTSRENRRVSCDTLHGCMAAQSEREGAKCESRSDDDEKMWKVGKTLASSPSKWKTFSRVFSVIRSSTECWHNFSVVSVQQVLVVIFNWKPISRCVAWYFTENSKLLFAYSSQVSKFNHLENFPFSTRERFFMLTQHLTVFKNKTLICSTSHLTRMHRARAAFHGCATWQIYRCDASRYFLHISFNIFSRRADIRAPKGKIGISPKKNSQATTLSSRSREKSVYKQRLNLFSCASAR